MKSIVLLFLIFGGFILGKAGVFIVNEGQHAIVKQLGRPVGKPISKAGVYFKLPFVQDVQYVEKRILSWDGDPNQITTKDKKFIGVDTTARWRIVDPLKFIKKVQNEYGARSRLDAVLDSKTREAISSHNLVEAVRNTNNIFEELEQRKQAQGTNEADEEVTGEIEKIEVGRERISQIIAESASKNLLGLGIEVVDVQLRRISYEKSVEAKVYERMVSERKRIAEKIRSIGQGEKAKIEGRISRDLQTIESESYRKAQTVKGKAEAEAIKIYASSLSRDPQFYEFTRTMQAYRETLGKKGDKVNFILSSDTDFLKYFKKGVR